MKVADLQQHLADLGRMLEAAGAKSVATDLAAIQKGLSPFRELPLKGFADFLVRAEAYRAGGEVPPVAPKSGGKGKGAAAKAAAKPALPDAAALAQEVRSLYDRAADPAVTAEQIDALGGRLAGLTKDGLVAVAEAIDMRGMKSKKKDEILAAIQNRIRTRKGATQKVGMIDRLGQDASNAASAPRPEGGGAVADRSDGSPSQVPK
jgi:hypothetical protein